MKRHRLFFGSLFLFLFLIRQKEATLYHITIQQNPEEMLDLYRRIADSEIDTFE